MVPELLVCVHNTGRSQLAVARAGGRMHVRPAGSLPAAEIDPGVLAALAEIGLDVRPGSRTTAYR